MDTHGPDIRPGDDGPGTLIGRTLIETRFGVHALRALRDGVFAVAVALAARPGHRGLLVLVEPRVTDERLADEVAKYRALFRDEFSGRLHVVTIRGGRCGELPRGTTPAVRRFLEDLARREDAGVRAARLPKPDFEFVIGQILIRQWMIGAGPMTADWLGAAAGCSFPTVARVVKGLGGVVRRHSDRRFELDRFPAREWERMLAVADRARSTVRFRDRSRQARSPESLLRRLAGLKNPSIGIGGTLGAKYHYPGLDFVGTARLDLSVHAPKGAADLGFVERLDPAFTRMEDPAEPASLVVHFVRRRESFFDTEPGGTTWADPVECLLDLHGARLESQAAEMVEFFARRVKERGRG